MGFFDRVGNLGKGLVKVWGDPETRKRERDRRLAALESELERLVGRAGGSAPSETEKKSFLSKLEQAYIDGVLTEDEYRRKRTEATAGAAGPTAGPTASPTAAPQTGGADEPDGDKPPEAPVKRTL